jgi:hypothetical protein
MQLNLVEVVGSSMQIAIIEIKLSKMRSKNKEVETNKPR